VVFEGFLDFGQSVEPREKGGAFFAVVQALVEFVADDAVEVCDFAISRHRNFHWLWG
jgi:hypothetical protein